MIFYKLLPLYSNDSFMSLMYILFYDPDNWFIRLCNWVAEKMFLYICIICFGIMVLKELFGGGGLE